MEFSLVCVLNEFKKILFHTNQQYCKFSAFWQEVSNWWGFFIPKKNLVTLFFTLDIRLVKHILLNYAIVKVYQHVVLKTLFRRSWTSTSFGSKYTVYSHKRRQWRIFWLQYSCQSLGSRCKLEVRRSNLV